MIGLDIDGVLAGFYLGVCNKYKRPVLTTYSWDVPWIDEIFSDLIFDNDFWENLPILNRVPQGLKVGAYISSMPPSQFYSRLKWLKKYNFPEAPLYCSNDKVATCKEVGVTCFIDDKPSTVAALNKAGIMCVRYRPFYMEGPITKWDSTDFTRALIKLLEYIRKK